MHLNALVEQVSGRVPAPRGDHPHIVQPLKNLLLFRQGGPGALDGMLYKPVLCLILQGRKQVAIAGESLSFGVGECLLVSHDLPVFSRITNVPYLSLVFDVDLAIIRGLQDEVGFTVLDSERARAAQVHRADDGLIDALRRYVALADAPADAKVLRPIVSKEIHYRLLVAPFGSMLRKLRSHDGPESAISRAIGLIRSDLRSPISVPEVARRVSMSESSFHKHFRTVAGATPLQYLKDLRLVEARRMLKTTGASVTSIAFDVGYASPSQFSREYARKFGVPPSRDAAEDNLG
jgi:AraC-like DNA-binding protein